MKVVVSQPDAATARVTVTRSQPNVAVRGAGLAVRVTVAGAQGRPGPTSPKGVALEWPANGEDVTMFYAAFECTVEAVHAVARGGTYVDVEVRHGPDRETPGTLMASGRVTAAGGELDMDVAPATVPFGDYVWFVVTGVSGEVRELHLTSWF